MMLFVNILSASYYKKLEGNTTKSFVEVVISSKMIENVMKSGRLDAGEKKGGTTQKNEDEAEVMFLGGQPNRGYTL